MDENEYNEGLAGKYIITFVIIAVLIAVASSAITYYYVKTGVTVNNSILDLQSAKDDLENVAETKDEEKDVEIIGTNEINTEKNLTQKSELTTDIVAGTLQKFRTVIDNYYIGDIDEMDLLDGAIKGYISGLGDEYSEYMTADEWKEYQADALGNYVGVGIYMSMDKQNNIVIVAPIKGTPADEAGIQPGDIIVQIDGESTSSMTSTDAASKIKGAEGTKVSLKLLRDDDYVDVELERKAIKVYHVESEMKEDGIGYIQLLTFDSGCAEEVKKAYESLKSQGATKIIFDLRNNTGGLVDEALDIADYMIAKDKTVLITVDSKGNKEYSRSNHDETMDCPIVVLVNEYSASASEILTGALKDNEEAKVVGTKTYGKGVIQNVFQLNDGSALKLTIAEYYTPNEIRINKIGIEPDEVVEDVEQEKDEEQIDEQLDRAIEIIKGM